jgi:apolipoprotein D and lipocalin family protein
VHYLRTLLLFIPAALTWAGSAPVEAVPPVDVERYAGKWYEIAHFPNRLQRDCAADATSTYTPRPDGKIGVLNECRTKEGRVKTVRATARPADENGPNTKLKVSLFWPFSAQCWIIGIDPDYRWAVVGDPDRKYLWVLNREPQMDEGEYERALETARAQGFDTGRLTKTEQTSAPRLSNSTVTSNAPDRKPSWPRPGA